MGAAMIYGDFGDVPANAYGALYADPAWKFKTRSDKGLGRGAERHYPTMTLAEIKAMRVREIARRDCHLFLWTTGPHLRQAFDVMDAWGFRYSTMAFVWIKLLRRFGDAPAMFYDLKADFHAGMGYTTMSNAEFCLLGRRGRPVRATAGIRQVCVAPVREHSRKPDEIRDRIAAYVGSVPKLEMNARQEFAGWDQWGNEVRKFNEESTR